MTDWTHVSFDTLKPSPWKNGGGTTCELWRLPAENTQSGEAHAVRISIAEIEGAQDFSLFAEMDRIIMQLDGPAMELTIDDRPQRLEIERPFPFMGEQRSHCRLLGEGKAHDLNLMYLRERYAGAMAVQSVKAGDAVNFSPSGLYGAVLALTPVTLKSPGINLNRFDLLLGHNPSSLVVDTTGRLAHITLISF